MMHHDLEGLEKENGSNKSNSTLVSVDYTHCHRLDPIYLYGIHKEAESRQMKHMTIPAWESATAQSSGINS